MGYSIPGKKLWGTLITIQGIGKMMVWLYYRLGKERKPRRKDWN